MIRKEPLHVKSSEQRKNTQGCKRKEPSYLQRIYPISITSHLSEEMLKAKKEQEDVLQALTITNCKPGSLYLAMLFVAS